MKVATAICLFSVFCNPIMKIALAGDLPVEVTVRLLGPNNTPLPPEKVPSVRKSDEQWLKQLGPERFRILRSQGTERPFCGTLLDNQKTGIYFCAGCDLPLFSSKTKFHSGTGWPSFFEPFARENVLEIQDKVMACFARKFAVAVAVDISDTSFLTVHHRPDSDTA